MPAMIQRRAAQWVSKYIQTQVQIQMQLSLISNSSWVLARIARNLLHKEWKLKSILIDIDAMLSNYIYSMGGALDFPGFDGWHHLANCKSFTYISFRCKCQALLSLIFWTVTYRPRIGPSAHLRVLIPRN